MVENGRKMFINVMWFIIVNYFGFNDSTTLENTTIQTSFNHPKFKVLFCNSGNLHKKEALSKSSDVFYEMKMIRI